MAPECYICTAPIAGRARGITCSRSCRAKLAGLRMTEEWRKPRVYPAELVDRVRDLYVNQGMTVAQVQAEVGRGVSVPRLMIRHGIRTRPEARRFQPGENHPGWAGDAPSYKAAHDRVKALRGPAPSHPCVDCSEGALDWSYVGGCPKELRDPRSGCAYSPDSSRYVSRCRRCHIIHDRDRLTNGQFAPRGEWAS